MQRNIILQEVAPLSADGNYSREKKLSIIYNYNMMYVKKPLNMINAVVQQQEEEIPNQTE